MTDKQQKALAFGIFMTLSGLQKLVNTRSTCDHLPEIRAWREVADEAKMGLFTNFGPWKEKP